MGRVGVMETAEAIGDELANGGSISKHGGLVTMSWIDWATTGVFADAGETE